MGFLYPDADEPLHRREPITTEVVSPRIYLRGHIDKYTQISHGFNYEDARELRAALDAGIREFERKYRR